VSGLRDEAVESTWLADLECCAGVDIGWRGDVIRRLRRAQIQHGDRWETYSLKQRQSCLSRQAAAAVLLESHVGALRGHPSLAGRAAAVGLPSTHLGGPLDLRGAARDAEARQRERHGRWLLGGAHAAVVDGQLVGSRVEDGVPFELWLE
jgi:hypothetical protein